MVVVVVLWWCLGGCLVVVNPRKIRMLMKIEVQHVGTVPLELLPRPVTIYTSLLL